MEAKLDEIIGQQLAFWEASGWDVNRSLPGVLGHWLTGKHVVGLEAQVGQESCASWLESRVDTNIDCRDRQDASGWPACRRIGQDSGASWLGSTAEAKPGEILLLRSKWEGCTQHTANILILYILFEEQGT